MSARDSILHNIRTSQKGKEAFVPNEPDWFSPILHNATGDLIDFFKKEIESVGAKCIVCESEQQLVVFCRDVIGKLGLKNVVAAIEIPNLYCIEGVSALDSTNIEHADGVITNCKALIAQTGTVLVSSEMSGGRSAAIFGVVHIIVAHQKQLKSSLHQALVDLKAEYGSDLPSQISFITGSSRTADIEKTLVMGAHGPVKLVVFIIK